MAGGAGAGAGNPGGQANRQKETIDGLKDVLASTVGAPAAGQLIREYTKQHGGVRNFYNLVGSPHSGFAAELGKMQKYMDGGGGSDSGHIARINKLHTVLMRNSEGSEIPIVGTVQNREGGGLSASINPGNPIFQFSKSQADQHWSRFDKGEREKLSAYQGSINPYEEPKPSDELTIDAVEDTSALEGGGGGGGGVGNTNENILAYNDKIDNLNRKFQKQAMKDVGKDRISKLQIASVGGPGYESKSNEYWKEKYPRRTTDPYGLHIG